MELKEYYQIVKDSQKLFWGVVFLTIVFLEGYFLLRPISYTTSLTLNVTRKGSQETQDYKFDDFYRLQADERFAETLVQWLKSPSIVSEIFSPLGSDFSELSPKELAGFFASEKRSSQLVLVSFSTKNNNESEKISQSLFNVLEKNTEALNQDQKQSNWFKITMESPLIRKNQTDVFFVLGIAFLLGIFLAFWAVFLAHYLKR